MRYGDALRTRIKGYLCIYCGEIATTDEHFPSATVGATGFILPACRECNLLAGDRHPYNFEDRAEYVKRKLRRRHQKALKTPEWSPSETEKLGRTLRTEILRWSEKRKSVLRRIAWNAESYLANIDQYNNSVQTFVETVISVKTPRQSSKKSKPNETPHVTVEDSLF